MNQRIKWQIFDVYIFSTIGAINIFVGFSMFKINYLSPVYVAFVLITLPILIIEAIRIFTSKKNCEHLNKEIEIDEKRFFCKDCNQWINCEDL